jgi:hypothetical protein
VIEDFNDRDEEQPNFESAYFLNFQEEKFKRVVLFI